MTACAAAAVFALSALSACGGGDDFCDVAKDVQESNPDPSMEDMADGLAEMADAAPDEIKDDIQRLSDAFDDPANADPDALTAAAANVSAYASKNCDGLDLGEI